MTVGDQQTLSHDLHLKIALYELSGEKLEKYFLKREGRYTIQVDAGDKNK